jgi:hypothetical protein
MIIDGYLQFDPTGSAITTTRASTNVIDLLNARDLGTTEDLIVSVYGQAAFTGGTSLNIQFQGAPDSGSGTPGTYVTYAETGAIPLANLTANVKLWQIDWPHRLVPVTGNAFPRYVRLNYVVVGTMTAGTVSAQVTIDVQSNPPYPAGITITN